MPSALVPGVNEVSRRAFGNAADDNERSFGGPHDTYRIAIGAFVFNGEPNGLPAAQIARH